MATTMSITQHVVASIAPVDAKGNPAPVDGVPTWASSDETKLTVTPAPDGMSADIVAVGPTGQAQIQVSADADLGAGVVPLLGVADFDLVAGQAVSLGINVGTPQEQAPVTLAAKKK